MLDRATMTRLLQSGFSRIPLHAGAVEGVDRYLIVKEHILLDPDDAAPVAGLRAYSPVWVAPDASLFQALNTFQTGRTHMAFVSRDPELARASAEQGLAVDADSRAAIVGEKSVARIFCAVESTSLNPKVRPDPALPQREHQP